MATSKTDETQAPRGRAQKALDTARERTQSAYEAARERTSEVTDQLAIYPVGAVLGGLALGAIIGALIPSSKQEKKLLGNSGHRLVGAAREAVQQGIDAGRTRADAAIGKTVTKVSAAVAEAVGSKD